MTNRLSSSLSPYLRQHRDNPVDWWEWGEDAFAEASRRDVPVLLSVGYAACHWCHVMAHESFEDPATAGFLNERFVSIKVDREERPDIDAVYMAATQALTGSGGWPMTVFLDHDARPFYAGTYFPPRPRPGMPSFTDVLTALDEAWRTDRGRVLRASGHVESALSAGSLRQSTSQLQAAADSSAPTRADVTEAVDRLLGDFDAARGGFGGAPKFPPSPVLEFLLRADALHGGAAAQEVAGEAAQGLGVGGPGAAATVLDDPARPALRMATQTLAAMARGGMYDQLAGGFARYSVDADWVVPHFEKMLSDNAQLLRLYLHAWRATGDPQAHRVAVETAEFLLAELATAEGGFASSLDADSEGREGAFYVWTPAELVDLLGPDDGAWAAQLTNVTASGTFEDGRSVVQLRADPDDPDRWERCRAILAAARARRPRPARDDKVVASWNGLAIAALAEAGALLGRPEWTAAARRCAELLAMLHWSAQDRQLLRVSLGGRVNREARGVLNDHADLAEGLLALYQVTGEERWFALARDLVDVILERFPDGRGGFFDTANDAPALVRRPQDPGDGVAPSGWSSAANVLITFGALTGEDRYRAAADGSLAVLLPLARSNPRFLGWAWAAVAAAVAGPVQVAIVRPAGATGDGLVPLHLAALRSTSPGLVVATAREGQSTVPLLADRPANGGRVTAYPCRGFVCDLPVTDVEALEEALRPSFADASLADPSGGGRASGGS